ncbi:MAG: ABC transporter ATP-binding protein/permease [Patescibacteria group bacterium]|jgi:ABC-type transport system involved in Fe-S cluster assembly fused permease/ATPase subunit|nr:ABC transporter ATP-binding protein/permease [Patescibacteria group bacterium]
MKKEEKNEEASIKNLIPYFIKYKWRIAFSLSMLIISKALAVADPYVMKMLIDILIEKASGVDIKLIVSLIVLFFALRWGTNLLDGAKDYLFAKVQANIKRYVSLDIFKHLIALPVDFHTNRATGGISRMITRGAKGLEQVFFIMTFHIIPTLIEILFIAIVFIKLFPVSFTLVFLGFVIVYITFTIKFTDRRQKVLIEKNKKDDKASSHSIDALLNYETVKYFTNEKFEYSRYNTSLKDWVGTAIKSTKMGANLNMGQGLIITTGLTAILALAIREYLAGAATIGDFVLVTTYLTRIAIPLNFLGSIYRMVKEGLADVDEMFRLLNVKNTIKDKADAKDLDNIEGHLVMKDVEFKYSDKRTVLKGINIDVPAKSSVALVGYSGSGKSTISKLLLRLYDVSSGAILLDGNDIRDVKQKSLRKSIGMVAQDTTLFNDTIYHNIAYGKTDATKDDVEKAAKIAHIHDFIVSELPEGYDTIVGERGVKLSGGEKQRVAIARMIIKNPCILIFDEATASLDTKSEKIIQDAIKELSKGGRTTVVIAHRLSTIVDFDKIVVMSKGEIIEEGNHLELLQKGGAYASLWETQSSSK